MDGSTFNGWRHGRAMVDGLVSLGRTPDELVMELSMPLVRLKSIANGGLPDPTEWKALSLRLHAAGLDVAAAWHKHRLPVWMTTSLRSLLAPPATNPSTLAPCAPSPELEMYPMAIPRPNLAYEVLTHFGLSEDPFDMPENGAIFRPPSLVAAEKALLRAVEGRQLLALVGEPGCGKSTLLRQACTKLSARPGCALVRPVLLDRETLTADTLAVALLRHTTQRAAQRSREGRSQQMMEMLARRAAAGELTALIIDEAHDISDDGLVAIKRLWDHPGNPLGVLLVGQLPLKRRLQTCETLREVTLRTRIIELAPYKPADVAAYLDWRWTQVGAPGKSPFNQSAVAALAKVGGGIPLNINNLAATAMAVAHTVNHTVITAEHVTVRSSP